VIDFQNIGAEFHELLLFRFNERRHRDAGQPDRPFPNEDAMSNVMNAAGAFAAPGETGLGMVDLQPGHYFAICFLPVGSAQENMPAIDSGEFEGPPHSSHGMIQEFTVP
jgi:hypothetical protein